MAKGKKKTTTKKATTKKTTPKKKATPKKIETKKVDAELETRKLTNEAAFSVWVDIFILVLVVLMCAVIIYGYLFAK